MITAPMEILETGFRWLLEASWQASVLALLVLVLQWVLRGRLNPRWNYALWLMVLLRLVMPVLPTSIFSVFQLAPESAPAFVTRVMQSTTVAPAVLSTSMPNAPEHHSVPIFPILALIWLAGAFVLAVLTWEANRRFARQVRSSPAVTDPGLLALFSAAQAELGMRRSSLPLIESAQVESPALMGLFRPALLLPRDTRARFNELELRLIFLHELAHLKRGDLIAQWLIALLQVLHWFNPVLWFAFRRMRIDREPATDALVLSRAGEGEKERYGLMLIKLLEHFQHRHSLPTLVGILEDTDQFKRRFSLIARFTQGAYGWSLLGLLVIGGLALACLTKSKTPEPVATGPIQATIITTGKTSGKMVRIATKVLQISDEDYQAHRGEIDASVEKGDVEPLSRFQSFDLLNENLIFTRAGQQGTMEAIRVFPYPIKYEKDKNGKLMPTDFARKNIGVRFVSRPVVQDGKITITGSLEVTTFRGFAPQADQTSQPIFDTVGIPSVSVALNSGQAMGLQIPGLHQDAHDPSAVFGLDPTHPSSPPARSKAPRRFFLLLTAKVMTDSELKTSAPVPGHIAPQGTTPAAVTPLASYPIGIVIPGKKGFVMSPYAGYAEPVDVRGYPPGTAIRCPYTNKIFIVPPADTDPKAAQKALDASKATVRVEGHATWPTTVNANEAVGSLVSMDNRRYDFTFGNDGSFVIPQVPSGVYNRMICYTRKFPPTTQMAPQARQVSLESITIASPSGSMTMNLSLTDPFAPLDANQIQLDLKLVEIEESVYQAHQRVIDDAIEKGGPALVTLFSNLKGVDLISAPSVTTKIGLKATIDIVREFPYPISFERPKTGTTQVNGKNVTLLIPPTPREFVTQDVGLSAELTPTLDEDRIIVMGKFEIVEFEGFTRDKWDGSEVKMPSFRKNENSLLQVLHNHEMRWLWLPGSRFDEQTIHDTSASGHQTTYVRHVEKRRLLCITASTVDSGPAVGK